MKKCLLFFLMFVVCSAEATDLYSFDSAKKQKRFDHLLNQLRCVVCQDENLASSNAQIAIDLRNKIFLMVQKNESDEAIKKYLTVRYGDYILLKPPFVQSTFFLWVFPFVMLAAGIWIYRRSVKR